MSIFETSLEIFNFFRFIYGSHQFSIVISIIIKKNL